MEAEKREKQTNGLRRTFKVQINESELEKRGISGGIKTQIFSLPFFSLKLTTIDRRYGAAGAKQNKVFYL